MAYEQKELTGALFKNEEKTDDTHADFNGSAKIGGKEYWLNAWVNVYEKEGQKRKYYKLSFKPKQAQSAATPAKTGFDTMDDDIPF